MITLKKYKKYFTNDDGSTALNAPVCMHCTEEKFEDCLKYDRYCLQFAEQAKERGWQKDIPGYDYGQASDC